LRSRQSKLVRASVLAGRGGKSSRVELEVEADELMRSDRIVEVVRAEEAGDALRRR
jgi:hypothetical protein